jgi:ubiquinone/menaquinone biosynthesis C-methylase UbiE
VNYKAKRQKQKKCLNLKCLVKEWELLINVESIVLEKNLYTYKSDDAVKEYCNKNLLQLPEEKIIKQLETKLRKMKMLDIGVGGGRTVPYFAKLAKEYIGIDYSVEMINACKRRFSDFSANTMFEVCDVRSMKMFSDNAFDFILFSFNGIDYISHQERLDSLKEIQRVGKPGSYFCFSTHNLNGMHKIFEIKYLFRIPIRQYLRKMAKAVYRFIKKIIGKNISAGTMKLVNNILSDPASHYSDNISWYNWFLLRFVYNKKIRIKDLKHSQFMILNNGEFDFGLQTYYIRPLEQIKQLTAFCKEVKVYSLITGDEIKDMAQLKEINDPWLYYLCVFK